jgi:predicted Zn-dependent peptidase
MIYEPVFNLPDFTREKDIIRNEILSTDDDIEECAHDSLFYLMYPGHAFGKRITGSSIDIERHRLQDLVDYHAKQLVEGRCLLTIAGSVQTEIIHRLIVQKLANYAGLRFPAITPQQATTNSVPAFSPFRALVKAPGSQIHFFSVINLQRCLAWQTDDFWAFSLISAAYGESMSSRLFTRLREERGLCYSVSSFISFYNFGAMWGVNAATSPGQFNQFVDVYLHETQRLYDHGLDTIEIEEAVTRMAGSLALATDDIEFRMKRLARQFLFDGTTTPISQIRRQFGVANAYTKDYLDAYIRQYLDPAAESVLLYGRLPATVQRAAGMKLAARPQEVILP